MLNIISLQALRKKSTGPSKVAKNLMKGLDLIGEKYVINGDIRKYKNIYILDDERAFRNLDKFDKDCDIIAGPIIYWKKDIPNEISNRYRFLYASQRIKNLGDKYHWHKKGLVRPVGIDTYSYIPSDSPKQIVLVYFKTRFKREFDICIQTLKDKNIKYEVINYDEGYPEEDYINFLKRSKYMIWIGRQETQGIALEEALSMNVPILLRDVKKIGHREPNTEYEKKSYEGEEREEKATAAQYFDDNCGIKFWNKEELEKNIMTMEKKYKNFKPRKYIIENLSLEKQAREMIGFYKNRDNYKKTKIGMPYKLNFIIRIGFFLLDNKYLSKIAKKIIYFYNRINKIR